MLAVLACVLVLLLGAPAAHAEIDRAALVRLGRSVLRIEVVREQGGYSLGSGVVVAAHTVVTNCHVTHGARRVHVVRDGARWPATTVASDVARDLCLLDVPAVTDGAVPLAPTASLRLGQPVTGVGYTGGIGIQSSGGQIVALHPFDGSQVIQSSNWFNSGASGGGLFDDDGRLAGILTFRLRGGAAHYFAAPADWVAALLAAERPTAENASAQAFWQQAPQAQPDFLRAAVLERDRDWPGLERLARGWLKAAPADAEPWYLQGMALAQLDRLPAARESLERSVELQPAFPPAWFRLGLVYSGLGLRERAREAVARLQALNDDLAAELTRLLGTP